MTIKKQYQKNRIEFLKEKARNYSIKEGIFATAKASFGDSYISAFAIAINSSNSIVALLTSISGLLGPLSQMFSSRLIEKYPRKKIVLKSVFFESLMWIPMAIIAFLFYRGIVTNILPLILLIFFSTYVILANIAGPAWFSWMGDIVDEKFRGRWFSKRNLIQGFVSVVLAISASFFLDYMKNHNLIMTGFIIMFITAALARLISWNIFKKQYEPKIKLEQGYYFTFTEFLLKAPKNNFGKFTIFRSFLSFATAMSSSLFAIYLLRFLQFNYTSYMIIVFFGTILSLLMMNLWGRLADRYGNYRILCITSMIIPLIPILWMLSTSKIYLALIPSGIGGIMWAGFNLAAGNFIYDNVSPQRRGIVISYYNMLNGVGIFLGAGIGAILIKYLPQTFTKPIFFIFILSTIIEIIITIIFLPQIQETRKTKDFHGTHALKNLVLKTIKPSLIQEAHQILSIKKYVTYK